MKNFGKVDFVEETVQVKLVGEKRKIANIFG